MSNSVRREKKQFLIDVVIIVIIAAVTMVIVWILSASKETTTITQAEKSSHDAIICKNSTDKDSFFESAGEKTITNEVKVLLKNEKMDSISLTSVGKYSSVGVAEQNAGVLNAKYNYYMADHNMEAPIFSPNFYVEGSTVTFSLYGKVNDINSFTSKLFYIDVDDFYEIKDFSLNDLKKYYENKGFSCIYQE